MEEKIKKFKNKFKFEYLDNLFKRFLNLSIFLKLGIIVGICVVISFSLFVYFYLKVQQHFILFHHSGKEFMVYKKIFFIIAFIIISSLILGAISFYYLVKKPLNEILSKIEVNLEKLIYRKYETEGGFKIKYYPKDELGRVVEKVNTLFEDMKELQKFRLAIEADDTVQEIYERLGFYLKKLSFKEFIIYQVSNSLNTMEVVYKSDKNLEYNSEKIFNADKCRAKRTGKIVTDLEIPNICKSFTYLNKKHHYCIPMISGNKILAIIQLILPFSEEVNLREFKKKLTLAQVYIENAAPVIDSKRYQEALKEQTFRDPLTKLYNRRFFESIIDNLTAQILRRGTVLGVLMADLDYFKSVNDKYGHDVGDLVLKQTATILSKSVRKSDLVVRFGGEEFLILLVDIRPGEAEKIAEKLRARIEAHQFKINGEFIRKTISIGVAEFPVDGKAIWEVIKYADVALYKAKELGRNKVVRFKPEFWTEEEY